VLSNLTGQQQQ